MRFAVSSLVVDVERFRDDADEPVSKVGMGVIYTRTAHGKQLRRELDQHEKDSLMALYDAHHQALTEAVETELDREDKALIVDCHSFPSRPLPCDMDQSVPRPHFCIGTDPFHNPGGTDPGHYAEACGDGLPGRSATSIFLRLRSRRR